MDLRVLVATLVAQEHEAGRHRRARHPRHGHRLAVEGELFARAQRGHDAMQLFDVAEARGDQQASPGSQSTKLAPREFRYSSRRAVRGGFDRRNVVEDQVAAFFDGGVRRRREDTP